MSCEEWCMLVKYNKRIALTRSKSYNVVLKGGLRTMNFGKICFYSGYTGCGRITCTSEREVIPYEKTRRRCRRSFRENRI